MSEGVPSVYKAVSDAMADIQAVGKDSKNASQGFSFRGVDAVVNAVGPVIRAHGVIIIPLVEKVEYRDVPTKSGGKQCECHIQVAYTVAGPAGDTLTGRVVAESMDSGDKSTAKAMSVAFRTFLLQLFCIPTCDPDPDHAIYERANETPQQVAPALSLNAAMKEFADECETWALDIFTADGKPSRSKMQALFVQMCPRCSDQDPAAWATAARQVGPFAKKQKAIRASAKPGPESAPSDDSDLTDPFAETEG